MQIFLEILIIWDWTIAQIFGARIIMMHWGQKRLQIIFAHTL